MTFDPFQTNAALPYTAFQTGALNPNALFNPALALNPLAALQQGLAGIGNPGIGIIPSFNPLQAGSQFGAPATSGGWQNPFQQNALQNLLQSQLLNQMAVQAAMLHAQAQQQMPHQFYQPQVYQQNAGYPQLGQIGLPYGPTGSPFGAQSTPGIAPQSWVGQASGPGQQTLGQQTVGQIHPFVLAQLAARAFQAPGLNPWGIQY